MPKLRLSHDGLSEKNAASMHQFDDPKAVLRFLTLPQVLWDRALSMSKTVENRSVRKDAHLLIQAAVAIEILQFAPMRIRNLNALRLDQHFIWHGKCLRIVVPMEEVKNKVGLDFLLPEATTERVKRYIDDWRMMFTPGASPYLFPGRKGAAKDCSALRKLITNTLWSHAAIRLTPHQFRHAAAKLLLDRLPGHYEVVRKLLGHKALTTTYAHYAGAETQKAIELYGEVITKTRRDGVAEAFRAQKQNPKRHEDLFMDPLALMGKPKGKAS
ncbi:site-specific integrase, partial [Roseovarius sp. 10]|uniref:site-specific integrase n=1 Tax=Roseovarius sp. 10 TaxID=3080563 RepID=UPI002955D1E3